MYDDLITALRGEAEWAAANEWETPIMLSEHLRDAADAIEALTAERDNAINELCYRCGKYKDAHNGACDKCRWRME